MKIKLKMKKERELMLIIFIAAIAAVFFSLGIISAASAQAPITPTMPLTPYALPNAGADPWSQQSWQQDYCNQTGMDFLVVLDPTACSPAVVRSDLLEEQNVPVMCRLTGIKINPLIQVPYIKDIVVGVENKSDGIAFVNFWPARTALTNSYLPYGKVKEGFEGVPTMNNLGYLWIQLARQPVEAKMPDNVKANLTAIITYDVARTYGVNEHQFSLPLLNQEEWISNYKGYSFWRGKGYVRLINITGKSSAVLGVYTDPYSMPQTFEIREGRTSEELPLPGFYCGAGVTVRLDKIGIPEDRARLFVNGNEELVGENEYILDSDCRVGTITTSAGYGGEVRIMCHGDFATLTIEDFGATFEIDDYSEDVSISKKRKQKVIAGDEIILKVMGEKKEKQKEHHLYIAFIGKQLGKEEKLVGKVVAFTRGDGEAVSKESVKNIVSAVHDYMKAHRGEALGILLQPPSNFEKDIQQHLKNMQIPGAERYSFYSWAKNIGDTFDDCNLKVIDIEGPEQASYLEEIEDTYEEAIEKWEAIAHEYSNKPSSEGMWYGVRALREASKLAGEMHKRVDQAEFLKKLINKYSGSDEPEIIEEVDWARENLRRAVAGSGNRFVTLTRPSGSYSIELLGIEKGGFAEYAVLEIEREGKKESLGRYTEEEIIGGWEIIDIEENSIELRNITYVTQKLTISKGAWARIGETKIRVINIVQNLEAKVTVLPFEPDRKTEANFIVQIGIEKRAVKLSPAQTKDMIAKLNKTIAKLEAVNQKLGTTIGWWKKACFAGASALWVKNFITGLTGEALARKLVMESWGEKCASPVQRKMLMRQKDIEGYDISISRCYKEYEDEINNDVKIMKGAVNKANDFVKKIKEKPDVMTKGGFFGLSKIVNEDRFIIESKKELEKESLVVYEYKELYKLSDPEKNKFASQKIEITTQDGGKEKRTVKEVFANSDLEKLNRRALVNTGRHLDSNTQVIAKFNRLYNRGWLGKDDVKEIYLDTALYKECQNKEDKEFRSPLCDSVLKSTYNEFSIYSKYAIREEELNEAKTMLKEIGYKAYIPSISLRSVTVAAKPFIFNKSEEGSEWIANFFDKSFLDKFEPKYEGKKAAFINPESIFMLVILEPSRENYYTIIDHILLTKKVDDKDEKYIELDILGKEDSELTPGYQVTKKIVKEDIMLKIREVKEVDPGRYENPILQGLEPGEPWNTIKFWERGPYEGKVAYMPIEKKSGWYFATKSYTGLEGSLVAYKESGDVNAVWICNVGSNGKPDFDFSRGNVGDDYCVEIVREALTTIDIFDPVVKAAYTKALKCASQAMREFAAGKKEIKTKGCPVYKVGKAPVVRPSMQCEDFMSPRDCRIIYNLCDPVMCPASRCDFGGRMPVDNVIQSGIIGSIMLCLPNFEGGKGVLVPICLTGVHAGVDSFITVLKSGRDCLQEQLKTGRTVGICDQMMSLYICEFFWRQFDPFIRAGLPTITESLINRGGGEYALFSESWKQSLDATNYFTEFYATETFKAFKARSTREVGSEVCKKFIGVAYPTQAKFWEEISKPESPPQAFASFQEIPLGGPSTHSQYKVYFHVYAGKEQGAYYSAWLRTPPATGFISSSPEFVVPRGFGYIPVGQYVSETPDFTAPSGYKEICIRINDQTECGFQQAGTNFALEQMQNYYLEDQIKKDIKTAKECVSGKPTIFPTATLNIQSAVEHALEPQIYKRGIIRICATEPPGRGTPDEHLWKRIGYCDSKEMGCWLYQQSVNDSISDLGIQAGLYNYSEQKHLTWAMETLGLEDPDISKTQIKDKNQELGQLKIQVEDTLKDLRKKIKDGDLLHENYHGEIGYSKIKKEQKEIWSNLSSLENEFETIRDKCAHPDEKARADWSIAEILTLKARLISLAEVMLVEEKFREAAKKKTCAEMDGEWRRKGTCRSMEPKSTEEPADQADHPEEDCCVPPPKEDYEFITTLPWKGGKASIDCKDKYWDGIIHTKKGAHLLPPVSLVAIADGEVINIEPRLLGTDKITIIYPKYGLYAVYAGGFLGRKILGGAGSWINVEKGDKVTKGTPIVKGLDNREAFKFYIYSENPIGKKNPEELNPALLFAPSFLEAGLTEKLKEDCIDLEDIREFEKALEDKFEFDPDWYKQYKPKIEPEEIAAALDLHWPVEGYGRITQYFGIWSEFAGNIHNGIDIADSEGTNILAAERGKVIGVQEACVPEEKGGCWPSGNFVVLEHSLNGGKKLYTGYMHLEKVFVDRGDEVTKAQPIGTMGMTGRTTGPHLHFEVRFPGRYDRKDPFCFFTKETFADVKNWESGYDKKRCSEIRKELGIVPEEIVEKKTCSAYTESAKRTGQWVCTTAPIKGSCWWDSEYETCKKCPENCEGEKKLEWIFFEFGFPARDLIFRNKNDCKDNTCGLTCLWLEWGADQNKKEGCYSINWESVLQKHHELIIPPEPPLDELQTILDLLEKNRNKFISEGAEPDDITDAIARTRDKMGGVEEKAEAEQPEEPVEITLTDKELAKIENDYRKYISQAVYNLKDEEYESSAFVIAILEDFIENYELDNKKLNMNSPILDAEDIIENTIEIVDKANIGDMLVYELPENKWHTIFIYKRIRFQNEYKYLLVECGVGEPAKIKIIDGAQGYTSEDPNAGTEYDRYVKYFTDEGEMGKNLYLGKPRRWNFEKILRIED